MTLKEWREKQQLSMLAMAILVGLKTGASIFNYERGKIPSLKTALRMKAVSKDKISTYNKLIAAYEKLKED